MSISIFLFAQSLLGLKFVIFTSILMFQRANISLFGEAGSLLFGFFYSLGGIIDENEKKNHFWLFSAFRRLLKKKMQKMQFFRYFRPTVQVYCKKNAGSWEVAENSIQDVGALELYFTRGKKSEIFSILRFTGLRKSYFLKIAKFSHF